MNRIDGTKSRRRAESSREPATGHLGANRLAADHGSAKQPEPSDPLGLVGAMVPGGNIDMLSRCFIEEFAAMGYDAEGILALFRQPQYLAIHAVYRLKGEQAVIEMIDRVISECGIFRTTETIPPDSRRATRLLQIEVPATPEEDAQP